MATGEIIQMTIAGKVENVMVTEWRGPRPGGMLHRCPHCNTQNFTNKNDFEGIRAEYVCWECRKPFEVFREEEGGRWRYFIRKED